MTKHFCDKCGKEVSTPTLWDIRCEARNTETYFRFEICSECMVEVKNSFNSKVESENNHHTIIGDLSRK